MNRLAPHWFFVLPTVFISPYSFATDYLNAEQAQKVLFPEADGFEQNKITLTDAQKKQIEKLAGVDQKSADLKVWSAMKKKTLIGYFIVDDVLGKHDFITYATAISPEGKVIGIEIMSYRETHGGQVKTKEWRDRFKGKELSDPFKLDVDVPNISGATLSCRHVLDGVKRLLAIHKVVLQK